MNDETKAAANAALVESMVQQLRDCVSVGDEMTLDHACLVDDAADWIAGEPARQKALADRIAELEAETQSSQRVIAELERDLRIVRYDLAVAAKCSDLASRAVTEEKELAQAFKSERDALRVQVEKERGDHHETIGDNAELAAENMALRAQVECTDGCHGRPEDAWCLACALTAYRAVKAQVEALEFELARTLDLLRFGTDAAVHRFLAAMDEAKPK